MDIKECLENKQNYYNEYYKKVLAFKVFIDLNFKEILDYKIFSAKIVLDSNLPYLDIYIKRVYIYPENIEYIEPYRIYITNSGFTVTNHFNSINFPSLGNELKEFLNSMIKQSFISYKNSNKKKNIFDKLFNYFFYGYIENSFFINYSFFLSKTN